MERYRWARLDRGIKARTDDLYCLWSFKEMLYLAGPRVIPVVVLLIMSLVLPIYWQKVIIAATIMGLLAVSWDFLAHYVGLISLGQGLLFGVGGYIAGALNFYFKLPIILTIPIATFGGAVVCVILLAPTLRLRGIYFALTSLVLPLVTGRVIEAMGWFEGTGGLIGLSPLPNIWVEICVLITIFLITLFGFRRFVNTDFGLVLGAIRDNDQAVRSAAINVTQRKILALFLAALPGTFSGAWMSHIYMSVGLGAFALDYSIMPVAAAILGGTGTLAGPAIGAFILVPLSEMLRELGVLRIVFYALMIVAFVVFKPEGLFSYLRRKYHQFERKVAI